MESVLDKSFEPDSITNLRDVYLVACFKDTTDATAKSFFSLIGKSDLCPDNGRFMSQQMRKCFPYNSSIDFDNSDQKEDQWD